MQIFKTGTGGRRNNWQNEAWELYRCVPELRYYVGWRAASCSKVRLVASEIDPESGLPTGSISEDNTEGQHVADIVRAIAGGPLGQSQLTKRIAEVLAVPGELWVAILVRKQPDGSSVEQWFAVTRREIELGTRANTVLIKLPDGTKHEFNQAAGDGIFRVWNHDAEDACHPDSPVRACLDPLREIVQTTRKIRNADLSRLIGNGVFLIPQEASLPDAQGPVSADKPGDPPAPAARKVSEKVQEMFVRVANTAVAEGPGSMASLVPIVMAVPGEHVDKVKHVEFANDITDIAIKTRNDAVARLAMGLDVSPERLLGMGDTNHWSSRGIGDDDVQMHIAPVMETICQAFYDNVLANVLVAAGIKPEKYVLWYDTSRLTADPDKTDEGKDAFINGAITAEAYVRTQGLPEDSVYDFDTIEGFQVFAKDAVTKNPELITTYAPVFAALAGVDFPAPQPALPPANSDQEDPSGADQGKEPDTEGDGPDGEASVRSGGDVSMAVELMVTRCLELVGKRRVKTNDHMQQARLRGVPIHEYHRYMPPVAVAEVPKLIKGWDTGLDDIAARYGLDADQLRTIVQKQVRSELTADLVDGQVV